MGTNAIVITGAGAMSSLGNTYAEQAASLGSQPATVPVQKFDFHSFDTPLPCFRVAGYDPAAVIGKVGLRLKDWPTKLLLGCLEIGFKDSLAAFGEDDRPGLSIGTAFGSVQSIGDFLSDSIVNGVNAVNPQLFANTVINAPVGNANIRYGIRTLSSTVSTGFNAGMDAIFYAFDYLSRGYLRAIIAGGLEEISYYALAGLLRSGVLSLGGRIKPFGREADGMVPGEGCGLVLLETEASATSRGATIMAEIAGIGMAFDSVDGGFNPRADGAIYAARSACAMAGIGPEEVDFIAAGANGTKAGDAMETKLVNELFTGKPVVAYKAKTGECYGASPALSLTCALADLNAGHVSGSPAPYPLMADLNLVTQKKSLGARHVLVNAHSCDGFCSSLVLRKR
jgi:3-oxoacyl-[acyl-carrier-protein] synthase II